MNGTRTAIGGYLVVALVYAGVLTAFRELRAVIALRSSGWRTCWGRVCRDFRGWRARPSALTGGVVATYAATYVAMRWGPRRQLPGVLVLDPQEPIPSGGVDLPRSPPQPHQGSAPGSAGRPGQRALDPAPSPDRSRPGRRRPPSGRRPGQLAEPITSNADFYIVSKNAGGDPVIDVATWRLRIDGEVQRPVEVDYNSLRRLPAVEITKTLECISNFVARCELAPFGCDLIGTARWKECGWVTSWPSPGPEAGGHRTGHLRRR